VRRVSISDPAMRAADRAARITIPPGDLHPD
jgi:hypothetical protein